MDPVTVTFRHIDRSAALASRAMELARKLWRYDDRISECHLTIEGRHHQHSNARLFVVKVDVHVPGARIHADNQHGDGDLHGDVYVALRDAIGDARRQLQQLSQRRGRQRIVAALAAQDIKAGDAGR
jgi:ribosome-associated translation inhibitor RaiA